MDPCNATGAADRVRAAEQRSADAAPLPAGLDIEREQVGAGAKPEAHEANAGVIRPVIDNRASQQIFVFTDRIA